MSAYSALISGTSGLVWYSRMGDASSPAVDTVNANNASQVNAPTFGATGLLTGDSDKAITFVAASSQYLTVADANPLDCADIVSMECWIKIASLPGASAVLIHKGDAAYGINIDNTGALQISKNNTGVLATSTSTMSTATIYHVVGTKTGSTVKLYINGTDVTGSVSNLTLADNALALFIGVANLAGSPQAARYFDGVIDEVAIYNVALSLAQVASHYSIGKTDIPQSSTTHPESVNYGAYGASGRGTKGDETQSVIFRKRKNMAFLGGK